MTESEDELSSDEEEILVYVEFDGAVGGNAFSDEKLQLDMLGIDTEHPIMQINGRFYEGTYEDAVGTYMFFSHLEEPKTEDPVFDIPTALKYVNKTKKILKMQRVFAKPRTEVLGDSEHSQCIPNMDTLAEAGVPLKYQDQALNFWTTMRDDRIGALQSYLEKQKIREEKRQCGIQMDSESDEDNPFAAYKQKEDVHKSNFEHQKNDQDHPLGTDRLTCETAKEAITSNTQVVNKNSRLKRKEKPAATVRASSLEENTVSAVEGPKSFRRKSTTVRKKKAGVVHDVRKKIYKKKRVVAKCSNATASDEESPSTFATATQLEEPNKVDVVDIASAIEVSESDTTENVQHPESGSETSQAYPVSEKSAKQLKREAKMREISERLRTIAKKFTNIRVD